MRLSECLSQLKEILQQTKATGRGWSELELGRNLNRVTRSLTRRMIELDSGYSQHRFFVDRASSRQHSAGLYEYPMPRWLERLIEVRQASTIDPADRITTSRGPVLPPMTRWGVAGFRFSGGLQLLVGGYNNPHLDLIAGKSPARMTLGTLPPQTGMAANQMRLDGDTSAEAALYPHESQADYYANAVVEITGLHARSGQINVVASSAHYQDIGDGTLYTELTFKDDWATAPLAGDTYDMHCEIPDQHMEFVLYKTAFLCWQTRGQRDEMAAAMPILQEQSQEFVRHITPRQLQQPRYLRHSIASVYGRGESGDDLRNPLWI